MSSRPIIRTSEHPGLQQHAAALSKQILNLTTAIHEMTAKRPATPDAAPSV